MTGTIFDISQYMLEDGPGIRTSVFLKGCPLRCKWCSNAYGLSKEIQLSYDAKRCVNCFACLSVCKHQAIEKDAKGGSVIQNFSKCKNCMACVSVCPSKARIQIGRRASAQEIFHIIERDRSYFRRGEGGITLSGGEILMQADFAGEILSLCEDEGIHTAIETSAFGPWEKLELLILHANLVFIDMKSIDGKRHKELTGVDNTIILQNIRQAAQMCLEKGKTLVLRFPLIPTLNDGEENIRQTAQFVKDLPGKPLLNVLPYHNFGEPKYEKLGKEYATASLKVQTKDELQQVRKLLVESGVNFSIGGYDI